MLAELAWLSLHPTRSALHHTPLAEAPLQRTLSRSCASASIFCHNSFRIPCQAARAHFASNLVPGGPRVLCPVENRPTAHGARARRRTWRGCLCSQRGASSIPRRWPRLQFNVPSPGRVLLLRFFDSFRAPCPAACALRPVENRPTAHEARARWRSLRGCLCSQRGALSIPRCWPRLHFNGFMPCGGSGFASLWTWFPSPIPRGPRALRPVENRPTVNGARARWRTLRGCLCSQRRARSTPHRVPRVLITDTAPSRRLRLRNAVT